MSNETDFHDRQIELDCLRIIATFGVIILHTCSLHWGKIGVDTLAWQVFNIYEGMTRWTVPVFVMISGALFLGREGQSTAQIYRKNIARIITAYIFWSAAYSILSFILYDSDVKWAIKQFFQGYYHMWFLFMIVGLYIVTPFLRKIVESEELMKYFLGVSLVFTFILPQGISLVTYRFGSIGLELDAILANVNLYFTLGYVSYFVYGYYLNRTKIEKSRGIIFLLGIIGFLMTIIFTAVLSVKRQSATELFYENCTINVMLESTLVFVIGKHSMASLRFSPKIKKLIVMLSKYSFGAYLVHAMIIDFFSRLCGLDARTFNPIFSVPILGVVIFLVSFAISAVLNHIPVINKYIV